MPLRERAVFCRAHALERVKPIVDDYLDGRVGLQNSSSVPIPRPQRSEPPPANAMSLADGLRDLVTKAHGTARALDGPRLLRLFGDGGGARRTNERARAGGHIASGRSWRRHLWRNSSVA